jgi:hypothetical protein
VSRRTTDSTRDVRKHFAVIPASHHVFATFRGLAAACGARQARLLPAERGHLTQTLIVQPYVSIYRWKWVSSAGRLGGFTKAASMTSRTSGAVQ